MNTMKKWVLAGLIGLSGAAVSMAVPDLDLNTLNSPGSDPTWEAGSVTATKAAPWVDLYSTGGDRYLLADANYVTGPNREGTVTISGSAIDFTYTRTGQTGNVQGYEDVSARYQIGPLGALGELITYNPANYQGFQIDFAAAAGGWLANSWATMFLELETLSEGYLTINLDTHGSGLQTYLWSDFGLAGLPGDQVVAIKIAYIVDSTQRTVLTTETYTESINSFIMLGNEEQGVPEPETVWMILAVLASLGVTFRRQLMDLAGRFVKT